MKEKRDKKRRRQRQVENVEFQGRSFRVRKITSAAIDDNTTLRVRAMVEDESGDQIGVVVTSIPILNLDPDSIGDQIEDILVGETIKLVRTVERQRRAEAKKDAIIPALDTEVPSSIRLDVVAPPPPEEVSPEEVLAEAEVIPGPEGDTQINTDAPAVTAVE